MQLDEVVIFGNGHITTPTMGYLLNKNIPVSFLSSHGKYKGKLQPPYAKDTLIRKHQYAVAAEPAQCLELAKCFVRGKLTNAIRFSQRQRTQNAEVESATRTARQTLERLERAKNLESLLGYEGTGAAAHYQVFRQFLAHDWASQPGSSDRRLIRSTLCFHSVTRSYTTMCMHSQMSSD